MTLAIHRDGIEKIETFVRVLPAGIRLPGSDTDALVNSGEDRPRRVVPVTIRKAK